MEKRSELFGRHLKAGMASIAYLEGKTQQIVEEELGAPLHIAGVTLQRYKAGYLPSDPASIELLAEACVRRGLLGRIWLERFLDAARLPDSTKRDLIARLLPEQPPSHAALSQSNLPPPSYRHFVMRSSAYRAVVKSLQSEHSTSQLVSLSGMGKTTLAHYIASEQQYGQQVPKLFSASVWISDNNRPNSISLRSLVERIAQVLDYPGIALLPLEEALSKSEELLRRHAVLIVIDNAETIGDNALLHWLDRLPKPSHALLISRFRLPNLSNSAVIELGPMNTSEIQSLLSDRLARNKDHYLYGKPAEIDRLAQRIGGNAKALELAFGLLYYQNSALLEAELPSSQVDLFKELLGRSWRLLDTPARMLLYALTFFPVSASKEALAYCADLSLAGCECHCQRLVELALFEQEQSEGQQTRYRLHPLVRAFATSQFACLPDYQQEQLHMRWLTWCLELSNSSPQYGATPEQLAALEQEYETIQSAIIWAEDHRNDRILIKLIEGLRPLYTLRGLWASKVLENLRRQRDAAQRLGDQNGVVVALAQSVQILSKHKQLEQAACPLAELQQFVQSSQGALQPDSIFEYQVALALYATAQGEHQRAEGLWHELLAPAQARSRWHALQVRRWLANSLLAQAQFEAARALFQELQVDAEVINDIAAQVEGALRLAQIALEERVFDSAAAALESCRNLIDHDPERVHRAEFAWINGQYQRSMLEYSAAYKAFEESVELFERLGMEHEAERALGDLHNLEHEQILLN